MASWPSGTAPKAWYGQTVRTTHISTFSGGERLTTACTAWYYFSQLTGKSLHILTFDNPDNNIYELQRYDQVHFPTSMQMMTAR